MMRKIGKLYIYDEKKKTENSELKAEAEKNCKMLNFLMNSK